MGQEGVMARRACAAALPSRPRPSGGYSLTCSVATEARTLSLTAREGRIVALPAGLGGGSSGVALVTH